MKNLNLLVSLISDEVNGLLEIHFNNRELAEQAIKNYIEEGAALNMEEGQPRDEAQKAAQGFFHIEHFEVKSMKEIEELSEEKSGGIYKLNILVEAREKLGLI